MPRRLDYPVPPLSDGVVALRPWAYDDVGCVEAASSDPRIPAGTTVPAEYTEVAGREFVERQWGRRDSEEGISLAIADPTGRANGLVVLLHREDPSTLGLGYWVIPEARGKGMASRAVSLIARWALAQPDIAEIEAIVEIDNAASLRVLQGAVFEHSRDARVDGRPAMRFARRR